jgi:hypothetical protein
MIQTRSKRAPFRSIASRARAHSWITSCSTAACAAPVGQVHQSCIPLGPFPRRPRGIRAVKPCCSAARAAARCWLCCHPEPGCTTPWRKITRVRGPGPCSMGSAQQISPSSDVSSGAHHRPSAAASEGPSGTSSGAPSARASPGVASPRQRSALAIQHHAASRTVRPIGFSLVCTRFRGKRPGKFKGAGGWRP